MITKAWHVTVRGVHAGVVYGGTLEEARLIARHHFGTKARLSIPVGSR